MNKINIEKNKSNLIYKNILFKRRIMRKKKKKKESFIFLFILFLSCEFCICYSKLLLFYIILFNKKIHIIEIFLNYK